MMTIEEFLKEEELASVSFGEKWLCRENSKWMVREHEYRKHYDKVIYKGKSISEALRILKGEVGG